MSISRLIVPLGLGLVSVALGIAALATEKWLVVSSDFMGTVTVKTYSVMRTKRSEFTDEAKIDIFKGLEIAGVAVILFGMMASLIIQTIISNRYARFVLALSISIGPILILIGLLIFAKYSFEAAGKGLKSETKIEYSLILMVVCCITGFLTSTIFAFISGLGFASMPRLTQQASKTPEPSPPTKREFPSSTSF